MVTIFFLPESEDFNTILFMVTSLWQFYRKWVLLTQANKTDSYTKGIERRR